MASNHLLSSLLMRQKLSLRWNALEIATAQMKECVVSEIMSGNRFRSSKHGHGLVLWCRL